MAADYEERKVGRYDGENMYISTAEVYDTQHPFETAVRHQDYNNGELVIVEEYDTKEEAQEGHKKWVEIMTSEQLPAQLVDVSSSPFAKTLPWLDKEIVVKYIKYLLAAIGAAYLLITAIGKLLGG